jgi:hypothetical protein
VLAAVFAADPAGAPGDIHLARTTAKPGDPITLRGRIMGVDDPFVSGRAAFVLGDPLVLTPCNARPGDGCSTPWDTCCDKDEDKLRGTATIQVVDSSGTVVKQSMKGLSGLAELSTLTIQGTVAPVSSAEALVVNATAIRIEPSQSSPK